MPDEPDTPEDTGTDNVTPESDTPTALEWYDPDEDQDTAPPEATAETDAGEEPPEPEAEPEPDAPALVTLPDGTQAPLEEVTKGYLRQSDYTRKSQEVAEQRKAVEADLQRIDGITQAFVDHLSAMVPEAPANPPHYQLAVSNPAEYQKQRALYDAQLFAHQQAVAKVKQLVELGEQPKAIKERLSAEDAKVRDAEEYRKLSERFPTISTPEGQAKFFKDAAQAASEAGFSQTELKAMNDHRFAVLAHWANVGMKAQKAREAAKAKVANVPPATPRKPGQPVQSANADAKRRFDRNPTLRNAAAAWDGE